ncbi:MAG: MlaD family protein [Nitriliruptorales bacterium]
MTSIPRGLLVNLVTVALVTVTLVAYAIANWLGGGVVQRSYTVTVPLAESGGLFPRQETTVLGNGVGTVADIRLTDTGVDVVLSIRGDEVVPQHAVVRILRRSTIGEQTLDLIPVAADYRPEGEDLDPSRIPVAEGWEAAPKGSVVEPKATAFPVAVPEFLETTVDLLEAIPAEDLGTVVRELALGVGGRGELLRRLNRDSFELNTTLVDGIPEFRRLIDSSAVILDELSEHRQALAGVFPPLADVSDLLAEKREVTERLATDSGTTFLTEADALVTNTRANQHCLIDDFTTINSMIAEPENLRDLSRGLDKANFFFQDGFHIITQYDPFREGVAWQRINLLLFEEAGGQPYQPHRPTPQTKPGAACQSPFGVGVNAVRQADHQPPDPTAPPIDFAPMVEGGERSEGTSRRTQGAPASQAASEQAEAPARRLAALGDSGFAPDPVPASDASPTRGDAPPPSPASGWLFGIVAPLVLTAALLFRRLR